MDDLLLAGTHQIITEVLTELSRDLEFKSSAFDGKTNAPPATNPVQTKEEYNFGVGASYVESMLEELNMSALQSS